VPRNATIIFTVTGCSRGVTLVASHGPSGQYRHRMRLSETQGEAVGPERQQEGDIREGRRRGTLPCGARYCLRCQEECGVVVNAYVLHDLADEQKKSGG